MSKIKRTNQPGSDTGGGHTTGSGGGDAVEKPVDRPLEHELAAAVFNSEHHLLAVFDHAGRIVHFNRACQAVTGYTLQEVLGRPLWDLLLTPEEIEPVRRVFRKLIEGETPAVHEHGWLTKNGRRRWVSWAYSAYSGGHGGAKFVIGTGIDLTDRNQALDALRESRAALAAIIDSALDAIITVNDKQQITLFNAAAEKMFGCHAREVLGQSPDRFVPERYRQTHRRHVEAFIKAHDNRRSMGEPRPLVALRVNGEEFPMEASISHAKAGQENLYTVIIRDITARVRAEQTIRDAQTRFRTIYENVAIGVVLADGEGRVLEANPAFQQWLGYSDAELRGLSLDRFLHPDDTPAIAQHTQALIAGELSHAHFEERYVAKDGRHIAARTILTAVRDSSGAIRHFIRLVEDITARKRAEARARRARARHAAIHQRLSRLTERERQVLWLVVAGKATKVIASELGASPKTIEVHRGRVMEKMQAESLAQLVQMAMVARHDLNLNPPSGPPAAAAHKPTKSSPPVKAP